ncbi:MAG: hydrogenase maturation nickel metallochaperone HypA [Actinomycetia bacterium]|nr:hydrogenase maturation nickel metallochaperone HypA [Actinomycetes bacterium]
MHELSLCRSIAGIVRRAAGGRFVAVVELDVGALRQVVPATLQHCWGVVARDADLAGSRLVIRHIPGVLVCGDCGAETQLTDLPILRCGSCASPSVDLVSGEEFMVTAIQVEDDHGAFPSPR